MVVLEDVPDVKKNVLTQKKFFFYHTILKKVMYGLTHLPIFDKIGGWALYNIFNLPLITLINFYKGNQR